MVEYIIGGILLALVCGLSYLLGKSKANASFFKDKNTTEQKGYEYIAKNRADIAGMSDDALNDELHEGNNGQHNSK